jgi:sec-independent protein translocase protein TatA
VGDLGTPELLVIVLVALLVFGGKKLPELARGSGRAIRIFKAEMSAPDEPETAVQVTLQEDEGRSGEVRKPGPA